MLLLGQDKIHMNTNSLTTGWLDKFEFLLAFSGNLRSSLAHSRGESLSAGSGHVAVNRQEASCSLRGIWSTGFLGYIVP